MAVLAAVSCLCSSFKLGQLLCDYRHIVHRSLYKRYYREVEITVPNIVDPAVEAGMSVFSAHRKQRRSCALRMQAAKAVKEIEKALL